MAELGEFYGVSLEYDNSQSIFRGVSLEFQENLILFFYDSFGDPINNLEELEIFDGTTTTVLTNVQGGSYSLYVETSTNFIITATHEGKEGYFTGNHPGEPVYLAEDINLLIPPCIEERTNTPLNFYHFHRVNNVLLDSFGAGDFSPCNKTYPEWLPNLFAEQDFDECFFPIQVEGEEVSIQLNFNADTGIDFNNCVLALVKNYTIVKDSIAALNQVQDSNGRTTVYFSYTHEENFRTGYGYQYMIYSQSDGYVKLLSNQFEIISKDEDYESFSAYYEFRNSSDHNYYLYKDIPSFLNKVRLQVQRVQYDYEYENDTVEEESTGEIREQAIKQRKFVQLEPLLTDEYAHDAFFNLCSHDFIRINGDEVSLKSGFSPSVQRDMKRGIGSMEFYIKKYSTLNLKE